MQVQIRQSADDLLHRAFSIHQALLHRDRHGRTIGPGGMKLFQAHLARLQPLSNQIQTRELLRSRQQFFSPDHILTQLQDSRVIDWDIDLLPTFDINQNA